MDSKGKIYMYAQCIEDGRYQVFIRNKTYDADFFSFAVGTYGKFMSPDSKQLMVESHGILSPFDKGGDKLFLDDIYVETLSGNRVYYIDTKLRKPTRTVEMLEARLPAKSKLKTSIGSETEIKLVPRKKQIPLKEYIDEIRINLSARYDLLLDAWARIKQTEDNASGHITKIIMAELMQYNELAQLYNQGIPVKNVGGLSYGDQYEWFIADFGLAEPNGRPPERLFKIDLGLPEEE